MHLCIDARMAFSSGIGTYLREVIKELSSYPCEITLLVDQLKRDWADGMKEILFSAPIYSFQELILFPFFIPPCDLFWSPHFNIPLLPIRAKKRAVTIHDVCHLVHGSSLQKMASRLLISKALHLSSVVLTVSSFSQKEIEKRFSHGSLSVVSLGVNRTRFQPTLLTQAIREKYRLFRPYFLSISNQAPHKNIAALQRAFSKLSLSGVDLVCIGRNSPFGIVEEKDLPALYTGAEALIFPSLYEGFGLPPLEAMSCDCPTLVAKAASIPEVCQEASLYFDPKSETQMQQAMWRILHEPSLRQNLIQAGRKQVEKFCWKRCAAAHFSLFEKACHA